MCNWKVAERGVKWNRHTSEIDGIYIKDLSLYLHFLKYIHLNVHQRSLLGRCNEE